MSLTVRVDISVNGFPLRPPVSFLCSLFKVSGLATVVFVTMIPSIPPWTQTQIINYLIINYHCRSHGGLSANGKKKKCIKKQLLLPIYCVSLLKTQQQKQTFSLVTTAAMSSLSSSVRSGAIFTNKGCCAFSGKELRTSNT